MGDDVIVLESKSIDLSLLRGMHVWRQVGMTGSDYDECVLCGERTGGIGGGPTPGAGRPCERKIIPRNHNGGVVLRVSR